MPQITRQQRIDRIAELLRELNENPPQRHETVPVQLRSGPRLCEVIKLSADEVLLNPNSHRIRSQLEGDPEWDAVSAEPFSEGAQRIIQDRVRAARKEEAFNELKESLRREGQSDAGVITHDGILVNANTRAVAMRELDRPEQRVLRVAVLPPTVHQEEISLLELRLQMQKQFKAEYSLTNELLFIEELSNERHLSNETIAEELRYFPDNLKKGAQEVAARLKYLDLLRVIQRIPTRPLRLADLDVLSLQQMKEIHGTYTKYMEQSPDDARVFLESTLLTVLAGVKSVHQIRLVDAAFVESYVIPSLEDDEEFGKFAAQLASPGVQPQVAPRAAAALAGTQSILENVPAPNVVGLIDALTSKDHTVQIPGSRITLEQSEVKDAVDAAISASIKEKRRDAREADKLESPIESLKLATREVTKASDSLKSAVTDPDFDAAHRKTLEAAFKTLNRKIRTLEAALSKADIIGS